MPKTKKKPGGARKPKTTGELTVEMAALKAEIELLREKYARMNNTLLRLCCPKEWFEEEIDGDEVLSKAVWTPSLRELVDSLK